MYVKEEATQAVITLYLAWSEREINVNINMYIYGLNVLLESLIGTTMRV